jgi:hypothetical protein
MINFEEINKHEVQKHFPEFYNENGRFFEIIKGQNPIGFISICPFMDELSCNYGMFMLDKYRLTKNIILDSFKLPLKFGFERMFMYSDNKTVTNFLDYMGKFGIKYVCNMFGKRYYVKNLKV